MFPYLVDWHIGQVHLRLATYGLLVAISFSLAYFGSLKRGLQVGEKRDDIENLFLIVVFGSLFGSRAFHVVFERFSYFKDHPWEVFSIWEGGYTFYGAVLAALFGMAVYCVVKKLPPLQFADIAAPGVAFGLFLGRIGCFSSGCCWGKPTTLPWGVMFSHPETFCEVRGIFLHPVQLYESVGALFLYFYLRYRFNHRAYPGQVMAHGFVLYGGLRIFTEYFRGDAIRGFVWEPYLSYSQFLSILLIAGSFVVMRMQRGRGLNRP